MAINTSAIASLLRPGLAAVVGLAPLYPSQWTEIFDTYESDKAVEIEVEMKMLGLAQIRNEGGPTATDTMGQRTITSYTHRYVALSFAITRAAIMDNLYKTKFPLMVKALKRSMEQTKEILGASILNNGIDAAFPIGDGKPFFATDHPIDGGTVANRPATMIDLQESSLEAAIIAVQQFKDQAGLIVQTKPEKLIVPAQGQFVAERLLKSEFRTMTAINDISAIHSLSAVPQGYRVNQYLSVSRPNAFFLKTDAADGLKHYVREPLETDVYTEFSTDNLLAKAVERYSFGVTNWRCMYASTGGS